MSEPNPELLILAIVLVALALTPLASQLVRRIGDLQEHRPPGETDAERDDDIRQTLEAAAYVRGVPVEELEAELRESGVLSPSPADRRGPR